jgi:hypothetical protein
MKIAIHNAPGTFSDEWIRYCQKHSIEFKFVNCYESDIISQLEGCDGLMWHWSQTDTRAILFARQLTYSIEKKGLRVFPDSRTCWHFDDKVGQKYLLEAIGAPLVPTVVFYDKQKAKSWARQTTFPKVFKLRGGASSVNVKLVNSKNQAYKLIEKAFGRGFQPINKINRLKDKILKFKRKRNVSNFLMIIKGFFRLIYPSYDDRMLPREKGYVYFQEFIPDNQFDIRIVVIGKRAFGVKRLVRKNDFRASGSGNLVYNREELPEECVRIAFDLVDKLELQTVGFDFVLENNSVSLLEISYGFVSEAYLGCPGFWDNNLNWHEGTFIPEWFMMEEFLTTLKSRSY